MPDARHDDEHRPFATYFLLTTAFNLGAWALGAVLGPRRRAPLSDLVLLGAATHEISRIVAKERVTRTLRRPFTEIQPDGHEEPVPEGPRRALGELITCPYCIGPWIALALSTAYLLRPNATRTYCTVLGVAALSDFLHRTSAVINQKRTELAERAHEHEALARQATRATP
jgi:hypothetical protein